MWPPGHRENNKYSAPENKRKKVSGVVITATALLKNT